MNNHLNLAALYRGYNKSWTPTLDYHPDGKIKELNFSSYTIGSNGVLFSPQAGLRASVTHLNNYMFMLAHGGLTKENIRILSL